MQRVAVARALSQRPLLLLADEPTGNLDSASGLVVQQLLLDAARVSGCALIVITHDVAVAERADRVLEFSDGKVVSDRTSVQRSSNSFAKARDPEPAQPVEGKPQCAI
jgi:predicted ABC-type transport system involved in lysophospholipase L1 biosynthesis ATPase subunit